MSDTNDETPNPYTRPWFIIAAIIVAIVVVLGVILGISGIVNSQNQSDDSSQETAPTATGTPSSAGTPPAESSAQSGGSICGLPGQVLEGSLNSAPEAEWSYEGTVGFPTSDTYGPAATTPDGVRNCFQQSPEGAVFAAANAAAQGSNQETVGSFLEYFLAEGPGRDEVLAAGPTGGVDSSGIRVDIAGFRVLSYEGESARVDIALRGSTQGQTVNLSMVYDLVWEDGDWKLQVVDPAVPIDVATIPDLAGYIAWGA